MVITKCVVCDIELSDESVRRSHLSGSKHKMRLRQKTSEVFVTGRLLQITNSF